MVTVKITLTLEHIDPKHPNSAAMSQTIGLLAQLADLPSGNIKLSIVCEEEDMQSYEDEIEHETLPTVLPMNRVWSN